MTQTIDDLITHARTQPAPLLPLLHRLHERDGYLSDEALRAVAEGLRIPIAELFGTVTFYHHFARVEHGFNSPRVCDGPVCRLAGAHELLTQLDGAKPMPCSGRCDEPIPVLRGGADLRRPQRRRTGSASHAAAPDASRWDRGVRLHAHSGG